MSNTETMCVFNRYEYHNGFYNDGRSKRITYIILIFLNTLTMMTFRMTLFMSYYVDPVTILHYY